MGRPSAPLPAGRRSRSLKGQREGLRWDSVGCRIYRAGWGVSQIVSIRMTVGSRSYAFVNFEWRIDCHKIF